MSGKDFELIAAVIRGSDLDESGRAYIAGRFARALRADNPRFDGLRFYRAGVGDADGSAFETYLREASNEPEPRYAPCAVFSPSLGTVWRVKDRQTNSYVPTMPRTFMARESAQASADNLNGAGGRDLRDIAARTATDGAVVWPTDPPRGMLAYAAKRRLYVTLRDDGTAPRRVVSVSQAGRLVSVDGLGIVGVERIAGHYRGV